MNRKEYIGTLRRHLRGVPKDDLEDVLDDYREHFEAGLEEGRSEDGIARALGSPKALARQLKADFMVQRAEDSASIENILRAVLAAAGLGFFNLVFVLGPFLALVGVLFALFAVAVGFTFGGLTGIVAIILSSIGGYGYTIGGHPFIGLIFMIGLSLGGLLFVMVDMYLARAFAGLTVRYLKWNASIIKQEG
ncbi:MAG: DUF1700 domain-containing protein [Candidatus Undinarchaeales archaeon]|jgi:uncharacterized membrane protein|nr:DUF1700 domain-containing protein [Candidatus Undinarchaeales archaeon]MDP7492677.1 DUF1700 domain-containing protein [Candidatus Undinarchaeales archaeon]